MTTQIDHTFGQPDRCFIFKSSDGKTFKVGDQVVSLSSVWGDMIGVGTVEEEPNEINLEENEKQLVRLFETLHTFATFCKAPKMMHELDVGALSRLLRLANKYGAHVVGLLVEREILYRVSLRTMFSQSFTADEIMSLFVFAERLDLDGLMEVSAKMSLRLNKLSSLLDVPDDLDGFVRRKEHLRPLVLFRERWERYRNFTAGGSERYSAEAAAQNLPRDPRSCSDGERILQSIAGFERFKFEERFRPNK